MHRKYKCTLRWVVSMFLSIKSHDVWSHQKFGLFPFVFACQSSVVKQLQNVAVTCSVILCVDFSHCYTFSLDVGECHNTWETSVCFKLKRDHQLTCRLPRYWQAKLGYYCHLFKKLEAVTSCFESSYKTESLICFVVLGFFYFSFFFPIANCS